MWPFRRRDEQRSIDSVPWNFGGTGKRSHRPVSQETALRLAPVFAAHRHLTDTISTLPLKAYRRLGDRREPMPNLPQLFQFLEEDGTLVDWLTKAVSSMVAQGNAIGFIVNIDGFGFPTVVDWRPKSEFTVDDQIPGRPVWYWNGRRIERSSIVHIPWITVAGKTLGLSPLEHFALTVNVGLKAQEYGEGWFDAGGVPPGKFKNSGRTINSEEATKVKSRLVQAIKTREPIVYGSDWDYDVLALPPEQAQFVETQKLTATQIAAIYGIAPEEIGGESPNSLDYTTEELRQIRRMADIRPWLTRLETGLSALLPERQYVKFNQNATVRADIKSRYEVHKIARDIGLVSIDEIREVEDMSPLPNGQGADYTPLSVASSAPMEAQRALEPPRVNGWVAPDIIVEQIGRS